MLDQFPLSRVVIAELEDHDEFILSFPHISLDGWSIFIILRELIENYCSLVTEGKTCQFENKGDLKEFINYQRKLDYTEAEKYWKEYLTDFIEKMRYGELQSKMMTSEALFRRISASVKRKQMTLMKKLK